MEAPSVGGVVKSIIVVVDKLRVGVGDAVDELDEDVVDVVEDVEDSVVEDVEDNVVEDVVELEVVEDDGYVDVIVACVDEGVTPVLVDDDAAWVTDEK